MSVNLKITVDNDNDYITRLPQPLTTLQVEEAFAQAKAWFYQVVDHDNDKDAA